MIIGCFALIQPFATLERQFQLIKELGFAHADLTDNHDGAGLGREFGFAATASLDGHPGDLRRMVQRHGLTLTSVCAHANLLDPASPERYGTSQIIKAIRLAHHLGIKQVITTEGEPHTDFGHALKGRDQLLVIAEKLYEPIRWAE
jgi:inosose dehydratase